jgi:type VI secretion system protein ImpE
VPFSRLRRVTIDQPTDLRDFVWTPAHFEFENGGSAAGLIPTRYPGSESSSDGLIVLARKTIWQEVAEDAHHGLGQRIIATESDETPLMDIRSIVIHADRDGETGPRSGDRER